MSDEKEIVVVAIDLHKGSNRVMYRALAAAADTEGIVHLIHVAEPNIANVKPPEDMDAPELTGNDLHKLQEFVQNRLADYAKRRPNAFVPTVTIHCDTGDPAETICEYAAEKDADLVVMGTHGRTGIKRLLIGSVAEKVVRGAGCPVLVVREKRHEAAE
jgi:nucleotide-binding universal stress UspA family protein